MGWHQAEPGPIIALGLSGKLYFQHAAIARVNTLARWRMEQSDILGDNGTKLYFSAIYNIVLPPQ